MYYWSVCAAAELIPGCAGLGWGFSGTSGPACGIANFDLVFDVLHTVDARDDYFGKFSKAGVWHTTAKDEDAAVNVTGERFQEEVWAFAETALGQFANVGGIRRREGNRVHCIFTF